MVFLYTRRRALIAGLLLGGVLLFATTAVEAACKEDALANVQGATLVMTSGAVYQPGEFCHGCGPMASSDQGYGL